MPRTGFHSEWVTIGRQRILLECRASFPDDELRFIAQVAAVTCRENAARSAVVSVYFDDKSSIYSIKVASTEQEDSRLEEILRYVFGGIFNHGNCQIEVVIVPRGDEQSDHYDHMEHLSLSADVAANRWKLGDEEYMRGVSPPS